MRVKLDLGGLVSIRVVGTLIVLLSLLVSFIMFWFLDRLSGLSNDSCTCGDTCSMVRFEIPSIFYAGLAGVAALFVIGLVLFFKGGKEGLVSSGHAAWEENLEKLDPDEKVVYGLVIKSGGAMFQSDIVEKLGWSKVKVTRTLDGLEARRLLERRRRGLTNIIVLK